MEITVEQIKTVVEQAQQAAYKAADDFFNTKMGGQDRGSCGFAWCNLVEFNGKAIRGNTRVGRAMKAAGIRQDYTKAFQIWNPSGYPCQNIDTLEAGAAAAAEVFKQYGFTAYAGSRLD
jgi:hypothetical protein